MARTKQTPGKTTGIEAPRITIKLVPATSKRPAAVVVTPRHERPVERNLPGVSATSNTPGPEGAHLAATLTISVNENGLGNYHVSHPFIPIYACL